MWTSWKRLTLVASIVGGLVGCGGGGGEETAASPGVATVGTAGGTVRAEDGAQVVFPKGALRSDTTIRIARDSTGAPPLPPTVVPAGAVYTITPHGGAFDEHAEVSIPVDPGELAKEGQLLLVTAEPGDTQWRVLSGASLYDGKLRAPVMHFSFFQTIRLVNQIMPALVTKIDGANNLGGTGVARLSPLQDLPFLTRDDDGPCGARCPIPVNTVVAELSFPAVIAQPGHTAIGLPSPAPTTTQCRPVDYGHNAMSFLFRREGSEVFSPSVEHSAVVPRDPWPRFPGDGGALGFTNWTTIGRGPFPGFGALHYYGEESPRIGGLFDANPPTQAQIDLAYAERNRTDGRYVLPVGNVYALPSATDNAADNLYTWRGDVRWSAAQNGSVRIDAAIMTTCGLFLEAVPLAFKLDAPPRQGYRTRDVIPLDRHGATTSVAEGSDVTLPFGLFEYGYGWLSTDAGVTYRVDFSPNPTTIDWQPVAASAVTNFRDSTTDRYTLDTALVAGVQVNLPAVQASQSGYYRVFWCATQGCFAGPAYQVVVVRAPPTISAQPSGQTVQVGETASFTVATGGAPAPTLQWQKRSFLAAAFGFLAWTNIDGATGATYTTPPLTGADTATQYRVWASNALGAVASDVAMLTVVEQFAPPMIQSQPGNLNVTVGATAVFASTVSGAAPLSYQWRRNGSNLTGANSAILTLSNVSALNDGRYDLVVTNRAGSVTSEPAVLQVTLGTPIALAPTIAAPPASITVAAGNAANFAVAVNGTGPYSYLWMKNGVQAPIPNGDFPSFGIASVTAADAGTYSVRVTNSVGTVVSAAATLTVTTGVGGTVPPTLTTAPVGLAVLPGGGATFAVAVAGTAPFTYQWRRNGTDIAGATGAVLNIAAVNALDAGQYTIEVRNAVGVAASNAVPLIVIGAPVITQQPVAVSALEGSSATLGVAASGDGLMYQWTRNQVAIGGATGASYTTPALAMADNGALYGVVVYNGAGLLFSQNAMLTVTPSTGPAFSTQPASQSVTAPATASFTVAAGGSPPPTLRWQLSTDAGNTWADIAGATFASYTTPATAAADSGRLYRAVATNTAGAVFSSAATLTVSAAQTITVTTLASVSSAGAVADNTSGMPSLSADGQIVAFTSNGTNLVAGASNAPTEFGHAYVRRLATGVTDLINKMPSGAQSSRGVIGLKLAAGGRFAVFSSLAGDLVSDDTNGSMDVFLRDLQTGSTTRLNVLPDGTQITGAGNATGDLRLDISADGRWVTFVSAYDLLGNGAPLPNYALYLRDTQTNLTTLVTSSGVSSVALSNDGTTIVYGTGTASPSADQLVSYNIPSGSTATLFSLDTTTFPDGIGSGLSVSDNGRYVAFSIRSAARLNGSNFAQVVVIDSTAPTTLVIASTGSNGVGNGHSGYPVLSGDGRHVLFATNAPNLAGDSAATIRSYLMVRDLVALTTSVASRRPNGTDAWVASGVYGSHAVSRDGSLLAFVGDRFVMTGDTGDAQVYVTPRP